MMGEKKTHGIVAYYSERDSRLGTGLSAGQESTNIEYTYTWL